MTTTKTKVTMFEKFMYIATSVVVMISGIILNEVMNIGKQSERHGTAIEYINKNVDRIEKKNDSKNDDQDQQLSQLRDKINPKHEKTLE